MSFRFSRFLTFKNKAAKNGQPKKQGAAAATVTESPKVEALTGSSRVSKDTELNGNQAPLSKDPSKDASKEPSTQDGRADPPGEKSGLDIVFLQDSTGSQGPYINSARDAIQSICSKISLSTSLSPGHIRFGLIAFRDHPPQDLSFVTQNFGFMSSVSQVKQNLDGLAAVGGGDGPEASTAALAEALMMEWREEASKVVVLITDAPPHGIGEATDGFPNGSPDQNDPLVIARQMAERGITLFVVACEPTLSNHYTNAVDFYIALTEITNGKVLPLTKASRLGDYIVGSAVEAIETEELIKQAAEDITNDFYDKSKPLETVINEVHDKFKKKGVRLQKMGSLDEYRSSPIGKSNINTWKKASEISYGRGTVSSVGGSKLYCSPAPTAALRESPIEYDQAKSVVMKSIKRSSKATPYGLWQKLDE